MLKDQIKILMLLMSYLLCLASIFTSHKSFQMGPREMPILKPQVARFCSTIFKERNKCRKNPNSQADCPKIQQQASHCESGVKKAYQTINAGGCPYQLRDVTLCELERCGGYHGVSVLEAQNGNNRHAGMDAVEGCMHHCDAARKKLDKCVLDKVEEKLKKHGIKMQQR